MTPLLIALASLAFAQDPEFVEPEAAVVIEKPVTALSAGLGGTLASGNSVFFSLNGSVNGSHKWTQNMFRFNAGGSLTMAVLDNDGDGKLSDGERANGYAWSSQRVNGDLRYDRFFGTKNSLYLLVGGERDIFAGYEFRTHEQVGYSRIIVATDDTNLRGEVGIDYAQEGWVDTGEALDNHYIAGKLMFGLTHKLNDNVSFSEEIEMFESFFNYRDFRLFNTAALNVKMMDKLSLKLSHQLAFRNVPVEGFRPLDQTTMITFVASIF